MLGCFPDPYPDELLYSVGARFNDRMHFPRTATAIYRLFGNENIAAAVNLPNRVDYLISALPPGHRYSAQDFIYGHTLYPFYAPFLPAGRARQAFEAMRGASHNVIRLSIGINNNRVDLPRWLRFCPLCAGEDRASFGETYWHRIHQVTGLEVCPRHSVFLEQSVTPWRMGYGRFHSAESSILGVEPRPLDRSDYRHSLLLELARGAEWLLQWRGRSLVADVLRSRYLNLLAERGHDIYSRRLNTTKIVREFEEFYSAELLTRLGCPVNYKGRSWLARILTRSRSHIVDHPLRHMLLITFLGHDSEQFLTAFKEYKPFGDGPWPCFNKAAGHAGQNVVTECRIEPNRSYGQRGRPLGVFKCSCGFTYTRTGPDMSDGDRDRYGSVRDYGQVWEETLRSYCGNTGISLNAAADNLGVSPKTLISHAERLGLSYPAATPSSKYRATRVTRPRRPTTETLERRRAEWLSILETNPTARRGELRNIAGYQYQWLWRYDRAWLETNLPNRLSISGTSRTDWKKTDLTFAKEVESAAERIKNLPGRPVRAFKSALLKATGHGLLIQTYPEKFPLSALALIRHAESPEEFVLRSVAWAEEHYRRIETCPKQYQFERTAHTQNVAGRTPKVKEAVAAAIARLHAQFGPGNTRRLIHSLTKVA
jgi:hypothetical protein